MPNQDIIRKFNEIADLLEIKGEDGFRAVSYRRAARTIEELTEDLADIAARNELEKLPGIGKGTADRIREQLATGKIGVHEELTHELPPGILQLLRIPGLGPKKIQVLYAQLSITSIEELKKAITEGSVQELRGFGQKTADKILDGIAFLERSAGRTPLHIARPIAVALRQRMAAVPGVQQVELAGSVRRGKEMIGDIDLLCVADDVGAAIAAFTQSTHVQSVLAAGETKASVLIENPAGGQIQADLRVVPTESFGAAMQYFTGSKEHNVRLREMAVKRGWKLNEYGLFKGDKSLAGAEEADIYKRLGLPCIPPELREDSGETELKELPPLVELADIHGDLHVHTKASDGVCTIEEMARAALDHGYQYLAITDHSHSSVIANGLSAARLEEHIDEVHAVNKRLAHSGITILAGTECDICSDGSLDYPDKLLARLDWVVASIHGAMTQDSDKLTGRYLDAIANPYVNCIAHPSGRLLGRREAMDIQWDKLFEAAARTGTALEVSSAWLRLDLKDTHVRRALAMGCQLVINTDAHDTEQLDQLPLGIATARRGWATRDRVLNAAPLAKIRKFVAAKRASVK
jgi:DNA polymerase (family 10)